MVHEISLEELHWDALSWRNLYSCLLTTGHPWIPLLTEVWIKQLIHISWSNSSSISFRTCAELTESYDSLNSNNCNWRCLFSIAWLLELLWTSRTEESQRPLVFTGFASLATRHGLPLPCNDHWHLVGLSPLLKLQVLPSSLCFDRPSNW